MIDKLTEMMGIIWFISAVALMFLGVVSSVQFKKMYLGMVMLFLGFLLGLWWALHNRIEPEICECCGQMIR